MFVTVDGGRNPNETCYLFELVWLFSVCKDFSLLFASLIYRIEKLDAYRYVLSVTLYHSTLGYIQIPLLEKDDKIKVIRKGRKQ